MRLEAKKTILGTALLCAAWCCLRPTPERASSARPNSSPEQLNVVGSIIQPGIEWRNVEEVKEVAEVALKQAPRLAVREIREQQIGGGADGNDFRRYLVETGTKYPPVVVEQRLSTEFQATGGT